MAYGYFPGCSLKSSAKEYDLTVRAMAERFGVQLEEIGNWNCCGSTPAYAVSGEISLALPWNNLAQAEAQGLDKVLSPCPACHSHMSESHAVASGDRRLAARLDELCETSYGGKLELFHLLDFLHQEIGLDAIRAKVTHPLAGMRAACYYGCLTRMHALHVDDVELPVKMEQVVEACGGQAVDYSHRTECCGGSLVLSKIDTALRLSNEILEAAGRAGANCAVVVCPVCHGNLDMRQKAIEKKYKKRHRLPVLYLSQVVLLSQGVGAKALGFKKHFVKPGALLETVYTPIEEPKKKKKKKPAAGA
ncbi:MAG: CoB--CoM heterodisulfide reductase iron-sulfur subunit B family protein [Deltaproteobacteria bacterium]|nr:CoB--CoM heterodisulfide reductase iron-sulfur subunit B family protein [Deltaproteobacteria bacterium]